MIRVFRVDLRLLIFDLRSSAEICGECLLADG